MEHLEPLEERAEPSTRRGPAVNVFLMIFVVVGLGVAWRVFSPSGALAKDEWIGNWDTAVEQSRATGKPALVLFTADWCPACRQLESEVLSQSRVREYLRDHHTLVVVDLTDRNGANNERAMSFGVRGIPTLILYDKFGQEVRRTNGMDADSLINWLRAR